MIDELVVRNLGVIDDARLEPAEGLTVISGETGAGKTLLLGALRLILGGEARSRLVGPHGDEATAEGRFFTADGTEVAAGRRLPRDGRSRAYLDGSISSAKALDEAVSGLVDIVGQHDQLLLTRASAARALVDRALDDEGRRTVEAYGEAWATLTEAEEARERLGGDLSSLMRELDLVSFQADEISAAGLSEGEDDQLEQRAGRLRNADEIGRLLGGAVDALTQARDALGEAVQGLRRAAHLDRSLHDLSGALDGLADGLETTAMDVRSAGEDVEADPGALEELEERLTAIGELRRKYGRTVADIMTFGEEAARRRDELQALLDRARVVDDDVEAARHQVTERAVTLTEARRRGASRLAADARSHLIDLGFSDPVVAFDLASTEAGPSGADRIELLFASDARLDAGPVTDVASGGELSRLVLALRLAGGSSDVATVVFDEVDAGVGGATALALGRKLADLAHHQQVLCVTHLPQVAAFADRHYVVTRDETRAKVARVDGATRVEELSRMLAGLPESERGREAAEELLETATTR